jgi:hypothetical protein
MTDLQKLAKKLDIVDEIDGCKLTTLSPSFATYETTTAYHTSGRYTGKAVESTVCAECEEGRWEFFVSVKVL